MLERSTAVPVVCMFDPDQRNQAESSYLDRAPRCMAARAAIEDHSSLLDAEFLPLLRSVERLKYSSFFRRKLGHHLQGARYFDERTAAWSHWRCRRYECAVCLGSARRDHDSRSGVRIELLPIPHRGDRCILGRGIPIRE